MHAFKRFGTAFGGYKMMENYPVPECGPDDIIHGGGGRGGRDLRCRHESLGC